MIRINQGYRTNIWVSIWINRAEDFIQKKAKCISHPLRNIRQIQFHNQFIPIGTNRYSADTNFFCRIQILIRCHFQVSCCLNIYLTIAFID